MIEFSAEVKKTVQDVLVVLEARIAGKPTIEVHNRQHAELLLGVAIHETASRAAKRAGETVAATRVSTGCCDSAGQEIFVGDIVRREVTGNVDYHGTWSDYKVQLQGHVPVLSYLVSEKGQKLPPGYTGCCLSDVYDRKLFLFGDTKTLKPMETMLLMPYDVSPQSEVQP
jgi:hypothetical protein